MSEKYIIIMSEGVTYDVTDREDCITAIVEEYERNSVEMTSILANIEVRGFSVEEVVYIYSQCLLISDGDTTIRFTKDFNDTFREMVDRFGGITLEYLFKGLNSKKAEGRQNIA